MMKKRLIGLAGAALLSFWAHPADPQVAGGKSPDVTREVGGSLTSDTATSADYGGTIVWRSTGGAKTQTLPACGPFNSGYRITVVDGQGTAATSNITINAVSGSVVGPASPVTISANKGSLMLACDGPSTTWAVVADAIANPISGGAGPTYPAGFNAIDATQSSGADICAKISAAATTLQGTSALGGTIDATGSTGSIFACSASMFTSWPAAPFYGTVRLGAGWISTLTAQTIPTNAQVVTPWLPDAITSQNQNAVISAVDGVTAGLNPIAAGYAVAAPGSSPTPSDAAACTLLAPCATLPGAQTKMRAAAPLLTYVRTGTYTISTNPAGCGTSGGTSYLGLTSSDNGQIYTYFPPDGVNTASFEGQGAALDTGQLQLVCISGSNITWNGIQIHAFRNAAISLFGGTAGTAALGNTISNSHLTTITTSGGAAIVVISGYTQGTRILRNFVEASTDHGIGLFNGNTTPPAALSGILVDGNYIFNNCTNVQDCGGIYVADNNNQGAPTASGLSTGVVISNNYVRDGNVSGVGASGIYFDNGASNMKATGNVVTGYFFSCFRHHGNSNIVIVGNICDLSPTANGGGVAITFYQDLTVLVGNVMAGNVFTNNIVTGAHSGASYGLGYDDNGAPGNQMLISGNTYYNYVGTGINSNDQAGGAGSDRNPQSQVNPQLNCYNVKMAPGAPPFNAPTSFPGLPTSWGPVGFAISSTGNPPGWPHSC